VIGTAGINLTSIFSSGTLSKDKLSDGEFVLDLGENLDAIATGAMSRRSPIRSPLR
jgi:hypothetical protein